MFYPGKNRIQIIRGGTTLREEKTRLQALGKIERVCRYRAEGEIDVS